jgi:pyruvate kinase
MELNKQHNAREEGSRIRFTQIFEKTILDDKKTKVICTLGPACNKVDTLVGMLDNGMNVARLNFSHGDHKSHGEMLETLREAMKLRPDRVCAVLLDTKGPEIRTGFLQDHKNITLKKD